MITAVETTISTLLLRAVVRMANSGWKTDECVSGKRVGCVGGNLIGYDNCSSNALQSTKSGVSNPSVNQP